MRRPPFQLRPLLRSALAALAVLLAVAPLPVAACRYSVRDTGFVDLDQTPWRLRLGGLPDSTHRLWLQAAPSRLLDSNLRVDPEPPANTPASPNLPTTPILELVAPDGASLRLASGPDVPTQPDAIAESLDRLALSPARDELHEQLLRSFAVLYLVEGTAPDRNATARRAAEDAIRAFTPLLGSLPKPVETPPRLIVLPAAGLAAERILVWSLGFAPEPLDEPRIAVLYGRGRRLGPPLEGPLITRTTLMERLTLIGQDCECDLDRSWLQGPVFPARWDSSRQTAAARLLGFDPENPLVRTEVTRIVLRGPEAGQGRRTATSAFDTLALGYREESVDAPDLATPTAEAGDAPTASVPAPPVPTPEAPIPGTAEPPGVASGLWMGLAGAGLAALLAGVFLVLKAIRAR